ncbi:hypothetical protein K8R30_04015 [archaeon]|nr:hypothetical protein [archaeon]
MGLVEKLICNSSVVFSRERYDDGTPEEPDVIIDNVWAEVIGCYGFTGQFALDIVVYLNKGNDKEIWADSCEELYRMPFVEDLDILETLLKEAQKQSHVVARERGKPYSDYDF